MTKTISNSFTLTKLDEINLKQYGIKLKDYKVKIKKMIDLILKTKELNKSKIFCENINKIKLDISFCNNETIHKINKEYRKKDSPTDVITFSLFCDDENSIIYRKTAELGQIIVSIEKADEQKKENNNSLEKEIYTLICHGILHLLGFDHLVQKDYLFVVDIQNKIIRELFN